MAREGISALIGVGDIRLVVRVSQYRPFPWADRNVTTWVRNPGTWASLVVTASNI